MGKVLRVLAIVVLLVTIAGAGVVLYALHAMQPQVVQQQVTVTPAVQAQETFDALLTQFAQETFTGRLFAEADDLRAEDCAFVTYTVRVRNRGLFPAEWITLRVEAQQDETGRDVAQLPDRGNYVLAAGATGDLTATVLRAGDATNTQRMLTVSCYVFGQRVAFSLSAQ